MAYITDQDLRDRLGLETYIACFDDANAFKRTDGLATAQMTSAVNATIVAATARANSWVVGTYGGTVPMVGTSPPAPPDLMKELTLLYAEALAWKRNPDYLATMKMGPAVAELMKAADAMGHNIQNSVQRLPDLAAKPRNVGGVVYSAGPRTIIDGVDGSSNRGDF